MNYSTMGPPATVDQFIQNVIRDCMNGDLIEGEKDNSRELLNYQKILTNPRARILMNPHRPLNLVVAVARFAWLVGANNRVEDIAYYEPKVRSFSDDQLTVPGSDYGMRLFQPRPGLNQLKGVVKRLREDPNSRQAAAVVWQPEDAVRVSRDIPCTFGMFFQLRQGKLHMTVNMRSNNAFRILPFNVFEFTMLHECVTQALQADLGTYTHWAASMHVYVNDREWEKTVNIATNYPAESVVMPKMPTELGKPNALQMAYNLAMYEAALRHCSNEAEMWQVMDEAQHTLDEYWLELLGVLACWGFAKRGYAVPYNVVHNDINDLVRTACQKLLEV